MPQPCILLARHAQRPPTDPYGDVAGVEAAVYYTPETLEAAGIRDEGQLLLATVAIGLVKVAFIVIAVHAPRSNG